MVSVGCFGVRVSVVFRVVFVHCTFGSVWVAGWPPFFLGGGGGGCPLGWQFVLIVFCLFVIFVYFPFWF